MKSFKKIAGKVTILDQLELLCDAVENANYGRSQQIWYEIIKPIVVRSVGSAGEYPEFTSSEDYDTVYKHLAKRIGL